MSNTNLKIVFTDLDGTLLNNHQEVSDENMYMLHELGKQGVTRVIATGRSLFSFQKVIPGEFPIDYLIFSSGAGIMHYPDKQLIQKNNHEDVHVQNIIAALQKQQADFMVHFEVPFNHKFVYFSNQDECEDFQRRIQVYQEFAIPFQAFNEFPTRSAQVIAIFKNHLERFHEVKQELKGFKIIRTTSPLDGQSIWMEIFPETVSKGHAADWLCNYLGVSPLQSMSVGNDYNDIDLLEFTPYSFVVDNAPIDLKHKYSPCASNSDSGFAKAVQKRMAL